MPSSSLYNQDGLVEAGCDEAGGAAVWQAVSMRLPSFFRLIINIRCSMIVSNSRHAAAMRCGPTSSADAVAWAVGIVTAEEIDKINILNASILAMHRALDALKVRPGYVIVDGNRFKPYRDIPHTTIVKGDARYLSIAAASILAKTYRDDYMHAPSRGISLLRLGP